MDQKYAFCYKMEKAESVSWYDMKKRVSKYVYMYIYVHEMLRRDTGFLCWRVRERERAVGPGGC